MRRRQPQLRIVGSGRDTKLRLIGDWDDAPLDGLWIRASGDARTSSNATSRSRARPLQVAGLTPTAVMPRFTSRL